MHFGRVAPLRFLSHDKSGHVAICMMELLDAVNQFITVRFGVGPVQVPICTYTAWPGCPGDFESRRALISNDRLKTRTFDIVYQSLSLCLLVVHQQDVRWLLQD